MATYDRLKMVTPAVPAEMRGITAFILSEAAHSRRRAAPNMGGKILPRAPCSAFPIVGGFSAASRAHPE